ncbi:MAG: efflux RND transporter periplasmic adaptor subunit [Betaproteobacteria bacterium]|nr:efflux RND transporter periplasmic adaptor subunit [Betaproteobacteria bacterium]
MSRTTPFIIALALAAAALAGYWLGTSEPPPQTAAAAAPGAASPPARKLLYYRNPMGLPDTSPVPKKDSMGMDYIPVYEDGAPQAASHAVMLSPERVQNLGVRTEPVALRALVRTVRALGTVQVDERRLVTVSPKFDGWIDRLQVNTVGQAVRRGEPLMQIYSPELVAAQEEYLIAARGLREALGQDGEAKAAMQRLRTATLQRLRNWDIEARDLGAVLNKSASRPTLTLRSPTTGVVLEKRAVQGMRFMSGEMLFRIADLSALWIIAEVYEQDLGLVRLGQSVKITVHAYSGREFGGTVAFIYPTLNAETRTARMRIELDNPDGLLKPDMYASLELAAGETLQVLAVPDSAVLDSGTRQVVLVERGAGLYEPRTVKLGARADGYAEVLDGVRAGETVVTRANFLIDAESNLKAALGGLAAPKPVAASPATTHRADAQVEAIDAAAGVLTLAHGPVASLKWPAMTMEFKVAERALLAGLAAGAKVGIEFEERSAGEYVITRIAPAAPAAAAQNDHKGH